MTTPLHSDHDQLAQATTRSLPPGEPSNEETAALRDGWLSLGAAIDRANSDFCENELLSRLYSGQENGGREALVEPAPSTAAPRAFGRSNVWPAILGVVLALTMLMAVSRSLWEGLREAGTTRPQFQSDAQLSGGLIETDMPGDWSDSLDQELDDAARQVQSLVAQATNVDSSLSTLAEHLDTMSSDLTHDSL